MRESIKVHSSASCKSISECAELSTCEKKIRGETDNIGGTSLIPSLVPRLPSHAREEGSLVDFIT